MTEFRLLNGSLANVTVLRFAAMVPAGAIADAVGSTVRVPFVACRPEKKPAADEWVAFGVCCFILFYIVLCFMFYL